MFGMRLLSILGLSWEHIPAVDNTLLPSASFISGSEGV